jgi:hypothetical protein
MIERLLQPRLLDLATRYPVLTLTTARAILSSALRSTAWPSRCWAMSARVSRVATAGDPGDPRPFHVLQAAAALVEVTEVEAYLGRRVRDLTGDLQIPTSAKPANVPDFPLAVVRKAGKP